MTDLDDDADRVPPSWIVTAEALIAHASQQSRALASLIRTAADQGFVLALPASELSAAYLACDPDDLYLLDALLVGELGAVVRVPPLDRATAREVGVDGAHWDANVPDAHVVWLARRYEAAVLGGERLRDLLGDDWLIY